MKTTLRTHPPAKAIAAGFLFPALVAGTAFFSASAHAQDAAKTYTLFTGADISVGQNGELHPVRDVSGGSWIIGVNGQQVIVSAANGPLSMKVTPSLKLTDVSATIANLTNDRAYTFQNDPSVRLTRSLSESATLNVGYHVAVNQAIAVSNGTIAASQMGINGAKPGGSTPAGVDDPVAKALANAQLSLDTASSSVGSDLFFRPTGGDSESFDALEVSFDVSAERRIEEPYVVAITRFHERGTGAGSFRNLVYAKALDPVSSQAQRVAFEQAGFPPGYELLGLEIHLYDRGYEVATNVAPNRVALTGDEAFDFAKAKYLGAHKNETLPATPLMGKLPGDLRKRVADGKYGETIFVRVSRDGRADEAFADPACSRRIEDPYLESIVRAIRFKPALAQGSPVDGVASLNLSRLRI
jgi:hypothetical protein